MPIIYVHGVAVRNPADNAPATRIPELLDRLIEDITWEMVEKRLQRFIAPVISKDPESVSLIHAYWGDLAARFAWEGASFLPKATAPSGTLPLFHASLPTRSYLIGQLRQPLNQLGALFFGDVFAYLNGRGNADAPGQIPLRMLDILSSAQKIKNETGEPVIVLTNSMGCQIMYDVVTHFLPRMPEYADVHIDFWCSVASQIGLFEELKLFLCSSHAYGKDKGNMVPFPDKRHLGVWWNVWDVEDVISYSVGDIIEGVDDTPFRVGQPLMKEHVGYLQEDSFYNLFAARITQALASPVESQIG